MTMVDTSIRIKLIESNFHFTHNAASQPRGFLRWLN
jgi:hypothetical protein